ncbi:MAG: hypothetical protein QOI63_639 [Thermoplasmata archaeon]|nr:hypothetical protein [Thermoplasmata archaeon]
MNTPRPTIARSWLAPAIAFLFLAGLVAPSVSGGPLTPPNVPAPVASTTSNLLTLRADGSVVAWQNVGGNKTMIHVQGVQASASGFNLADPLGRLVGSDQSSDAVGTLDFLGLELVKGSYALLGAGGLLATYDLESIGTELFPAFAAPADTSALARATTLLCQRGAENGASLPHLWLRTYGSACAVGLEGTNGCIVDARACLWAVALAWEAESCPVGNQKLCNDLFGPQTQNGCDAQCLAAFVSQTKRDAIAVVFGLVWSKVGEFTSATLDGISCTGTDTYCLLKTWAVTECRDGGAASAAACLAVRTIAQLALQMLGGGSLPAPCANNVISCVANCSPASQICSIGIGFPSKAVADQFTNLFTTPSTASSAGGAPQEEWSVSCTDIYDSSLSLLETDRCDTPPAPEVNDWTYFGWYYCVYKSDCTSSGTQHVQVWDSSPDGDIYESVYRDYVQLYAGTNHECPDPNGCAGGSYAPADRANLVAGASVYHGWDPSKAFPAEGGGSECVEQPHPPTEPGNWMCYGKGLFGGWIRVKKS